MSRVLGIGKGKDRTVAHAGSQQDAAGAEGHHAGMRRVGENGNVKPWRHLKPSNVRLLGAGTGKQKEREHNGEPGSHGTAQHSIHLHPPFWMTSMGHGVPIQA
jgi:hypothetical protein